MTVTEILKRVIQLFRSESYIREDGPPGKRFCIYSERTGKKLGCFATRKLAQDRLDFIKRFRK